MRPDASPPISAVWPSICQPSHCLQQSISRRRTPKPCKSALCSRMGNGSPPAPPFLRHQALRPLCNPLLQFPPPLLQRHPLRPQPKHLLPKRKSRQRPMSAHFSVANQAHRRPAALSAAWCAGTLNVRPQHPQASQPPRWPMHVPHSIQALMTTIWTYRFESCLVNRRTTPTANQ